MDGIKQDPGGEIPGSLNEGSLQDSCCANGAVGLAPCDGISAQGML